MYWRSFTFMKQRRIIWLKTSLASTVLLPTITSTASCFISALPTQNCAIFVNYNRHTIRYSSKTTYRWRDVIDWCPQVKDHIVMQATFVLLPTSTSTASCVICMLPTQNCAIFVNYNQRHTIKYKFQKYLQLERCYRWKSSGWTPASFRKQLPSSDQPGPARPQLDAGSDWWRWRGGPACPWAGSGPGCCEGGRSPWRPGRPPWRGRSAACCSGWSDAPKLTKSHNKNSDWCLFACLFCFFMDGILLLDWLSVNIHIFQFCFGVTFQPNFDHRASWTPV